MLRWETMREQMTVLRKDAGMKLQAGEGRTCLRPLSSMKLMQWPARAERGQGACQAASAASFSSSASCRKRSASSCSSIAMLSHKGATPTQATPFSNSKRSCTLQHACEEEELEEDDGGEEPGNNEKKKEKNHR